MNITVNNSAMMSTQEKGKRTMIMEYKPPMRPMPPHERKAMMHIDFDENDWMTLQDIFGDEDTAMAAAEIISGAPPEIQILAIQILNMIKEVA